MSIPGFLGSRLVDGETGVAIWGGADGLAADPSDPGALRSAALPLAASPRELRAARDAVRPDGVARTAQADLVLFRLGLDIYSGLIRALIADGYDFRETRAEEIADHDVNLDAFEFPYDWRRDVVEAAQDLDYFLRRKREQVRAARLAALGEAGPSVRFDLVAHSVGSVVARYYLMFCAADLPADGSTPPTIRVGAELVETAVMIAPPFSGSITALENLIEGRRLGPLQPFHPPALLGTWRGLHQLLPRDRHGRAVAATGDPLGPLLGPEAWEREGWGLLYPDEAGTLALMLPDVADPEARRAAARAHVAASLARAEHLHRAIDQPNAPPPGLELFLVVGGGFETPARLAWDREARRAAVDRTAEGDGVVLRASSLADERQGGGAAPGVRASPHAYRSVLLLPDEHVEITLNPVFADNLLFWLLEGERAQERLRPMRAGEGGGAVGAMLGALVRPAPSRE